MSPCNFLICQGPSPICSCHCSMMPACHAVHGQSGNVVLPAAILPLLCSRASFSKSLCRRLHCAELLDIVPDRSKASCGVELYSIAAQGWGLWYPRKKAPEKTGKFYTRYQCGLILNSSSPFALEARV